MDKTLKSYYKVIGDLTENVLKLCELEEALAKAASDNLPDKLSLIVKNAQPELLRFRGLDQKRMRLQKELGFDQSESIDEIIRQITASPEGEDIFAPLFLRLENNLKRFKNAADAAEQIMQVRLNDIRLILAGRPEPETVHSTLA